MPKTYEGNQPYIFVSYAHADDAVALPLIDALVAEGYRVWYDAGIELARPFPDYIADRVHDCYCFVPLISPASLRSNWCRAEMEYALDLQRPILPIYLEDVELNRGLYMRLCYMQSLYRRRFISDDEFYAALFNAKVLDLCLTSEGKRRRGAKPLGGTMSMSVSGVSTPPGVPTRASFGEYSWAELKEISQAIAAAGSEAEWKAIAKEYRLVDKDGKLWGDTKTFELTDGTDASVRILGFRHDELKGGGVAGISFEFANVPKMHHMNAYGTNAGGWEKSDMRRWLNGDRGGFLALLPEDLRTNVVEVTKQTNNRGEVSESDANVVGDTPDRLWLLSMAEVYGQVGWPSWLLAVYDAEGAQYQLYANKKVTLSNFGYCKKNGASSWWWLRSPNAVASYAFHDVYSDGDYYHGNAGGDYGVSPGFCF